MRLMPLPSCRHNRLDVGIARLPAELLLGAGGIGDELGGIAWAARTDSFRDGVAGDLAAGVDHLPDTVAAAGAEIELDPFARRKLL